jgi:hypothetical protein
VNGVAASEIETQMAIQGLFSERLLGSMSPAVDHGSGAAQAQSGLMFK